MLASKNSVGKSTLSSSKFTNSIGTKAIKDSFFVYCYKKMMALISSIWGRTRKGLWIVSTGFILLILPFTFAYISEYQKEVAKIMSASETGF